MRFDWKIITLLLIIVSNLFTGIMASQWRYFYEHFRHYIMQENLIADDIWNRTTLIDTRVEFKKAAIFDTIKVNVLTVMDKVMEGK